MDAAIVSGIGFLLVIILYFLFKPKPQIPEDPSPAPSAPAKPEPSKPSKSAKQSKSSKNPKQSKEHPANYLDSYKNLQSGVVDFDVKENYFALCCEDSVIRIYKTKSILDTKSKYIQGHIQKNQPTAIALAESGSQVFVSGSQDHQIHPFRVHHSSNKFTLEPEAPFIRKHTLGVSSLSWTSKVLVSCGVEQDTYIYVWSHSGELLTSFENKQLKHKFLVLSKDQRFFSVATWLGSARVFEFWKAKKTDNYDGIHVVLELGGHSAGLTALNFSPDGHLAITCGIDRQVRLWNINVQYEYKEHPILLKAVKLDQNLEPVGYCALTDKKAVLAIGSNLHIYSVPDLECFRVIENAHSHFVRKIDVKENTIISCASDARLILWSMD